MSPVPTAKVGSTKRPAVEQHFRETRLSPHMNPAERALVRFQSGLSACAGVATQSIHLSITVQYVYRGAWK